MHIFLFKKYVKNVCIIVVNIVHKQKWKTYYIIIFELVWVYVQSKKVNLFIITIVYWIHLGRLLKQLHFFFIITLINFFYQALIY